MPNQPKQWQFVEVELNDVIVIKRLPIYITKDVNGLNDKEQVRKHFRKLDYKVGEHVKFM